MDDAINFFNTFSNNLDSAVMSAAFYLANENASEDQINDFLGLIALPDNYKDMFLEMVRMTKLSDHVDMQLNVGAEL